MYVQIVVQMVSLYYQIITIIDVQNKQVVNLLVIHIIVKNQMDKDVLQHVEKEDIKVHNVLILVLVNSIILQMKSICAQIIVQMEFNTYHHQQITQHKQIRCVQINVIYQEDIQLNKMNRNGVMKHVQLNFHLLNKLKNNKFVQLNVLEVLNIIRLLMKQLITKLYNSKFVWLNVKISLK